MKKISLALILFLVLIVGCAHTPQIAQQPLAGLGYFHRDGTINWDADETQIDMIIVHHSAMYSQASWIEISDLQRESLYMPRYRSSDPVPYLKGQSPHSGHFRAVNGELIEVFYAYQWIIRPNGTSERLLIDKDVGWQAGNWNVNCRSIAICFAGDFTNGQPTNEALDTCAKLIADYIKKFPAIKLETNVIGHREVNKKTVCPGNKFLGLGGWKEALIEKVKAILTRETGKSGASKGE